MLIRRTRDPKSFWGRAVEELKREREEVMRQIKTIHILAKKNETN